MREIDLVAYLTDDETITAEFVPVNLNVPPVLKEKTITANGVYSAESDSATGYSSVTVCVPDRAITTGELNITPETTAQTFEVPSYWDGYGPVNVAGVTASVDANIQPSNIKEGVAILGVNGNVIELNGETREVSITSTSGNTFTPSENKNAITSITVTPTNQDKTIDATTSEQTINVPEGYSGHGTITVNPVTASIDPDIQPINIREGVDILGVTGTAYIPEYFVDFTVTRGTLSKKVQMVNLDGVTVIGDYALLSLYNNSSFPAHTHIDMSGITGIAYYGCNGCFAVAHNLESVDMSGVKGLSGSACNAMFKNCTSIQSVDLSSLTQITSWNATSEMFYGCTSLTSVNLSSLKYINAMWAAQYMFQNCTGLQTIDLSSLVVIWNTDACSQLFYGCTSLTDVDLRHLMTIGGGAQMFYGCTSLTSMTFPSLIYTNYIGVCQQMFAGCTSLQTLYFPSLTSNSFSGYSRTDQWKNLVQGVTGCTIHMPKNLDPQSGSTVISSLQTYPNFGGTNTVLSFDLPSTFILTGANSVDYERNPASDTETALAWKVKHTSGITDYNVDWTPYYTSGTADPQVGATIYSDASCTTAVTTISTIA